MDGILEQILKELKEIKQLLSENRSPYDVIPNGMFTSDTLKSKEAAAYLGIAEHRLRMLAKKGEIKHFMAGNKFLYKRRSLDQWLEEVQNDSVSKKEDELYGKIRKVKV